MYVASCFKGIWRSDHLVASGGSDAAGLFRPPPPSAFSLSITSERSRSLSALARSAHPTSTAAGPPSRGGRKGPWSCMPVYSHDPGRALEGSVPGGRPIATGRPPPSKVWEVVAPAGASGLGRVKVWVMETSILSFSERSAPRYPLLELAAGVAAGARWIGQIVSTLPGVCEMGEAEAGRLESGTSSIWNLEGRLD